MELFDSHAHYNDEKFEEDREEILKEIYKSGVTKLVNAGYSLESSKSAIQIANSHDFIYSTVGISPNDIADYKKEDLKEIENLAKSPKVVAIGEIGLDYYWNKENKDLQKEVFISQIEIANKLNLPIVIHTREAVYDTLEILKNNKNASVLYVSSEKFTNQFINAIKDNKNEMFRNKYRNIDVLLIDDIQFISGKKQLQEEFFHTFNTLHESGKQIVISSDRPPKDIQPLEDRLRTRFEWGLIADISNPDYETRMAILKKKAQLDNIIIENAW